MFNRQDEVAGRQALVVKHFALVAALTLSALMIPGCLPGRPGWSGSEPRITRMDVSSYSLDPAARSDDFVLLQVNVKNPCLDRIKGVIACLADHGEQPHPLEHPFGVAPGKANQFTFPFGRPKSFAYSVRCRLRFGDKDNGTVRLPSPWVKVEVPAPKRPRPKAGSVATLPSSEAQTMTQTSDRM